MRLFIFLYCFSFASLAQKLSLQDTKQLSIILDNAKVLVKPIKIYVPNTLSNEQLAQFRANLLVNKSIPKEFETQILIALSYYPELKETPIEFIKANIKTTMACRPSTISLARRFNRDYTITIDSDDEGQGISLKDVPFNAQIGVIGHELAHILDYENRNTISIAKLGIDYVSGNYLPEFEKSVDKITIKKGLGWQLHDWADFVLNKSNASKEYKNFKRSTYLTPTEIKQEIDKYRIYKSVSYHGFWHNDFFTEIWGVCLGVCLSFIFQTDFRNSLLKYFTND